MSSNVHEAFAPILAAITRPKPEPIIASARELASLGLVDQDERVSEERCRTLSLRYQGLILANRGAR
jgi:hypothetical protein